MDYEKLYKDALERAREELGSGCFDRGTVEYIFPELAESEDERIRGFLIRGMIVLKDQSNETFATIPINDCIAWLEKHKYTDEDLDKAYKCADEVQYRRGYEDAKKEIEKQGDYNRLVEEIKERKELISKEKEKATSTNDKLSLGGRIAILEELLAFTKEKQGEQKSVLPGFEEQEGVAGRDYIPIEWVEAIENYGKWKIVRTDEQNPAWSEEDERMYKAISIALSLNDAKGYLHSWYTTPEEADNWLKSLKDRVQPQPKQEWSKDDEKWIDRTHTIYC